MEKFTVMLVLKKCRIVMNIIGTVNIVVKNLRTNQTVISMNKVASKNKLELVRELYMA